jgi:hypothetical protein
MRKTASLYLGGVKPKKLKLVGIASSSSARYLDVRIAGLSDLTIKQEYQ